MPIVLLIAVLALVLLSRRADASTAGGAGDAREANPTGPSSPSALDDYFRQHPPPSTPGKYTVYDSAGQPTSVTTTVAEDGSAKIKIQGLSFWSYKVPGTVPAPPPPPPMSEGGAPAPPPVYGGSTTYGSTAARSGAGHFV